MKRKSLYKILAVLFTATIFFAACTKEDQDVKLAPKLSTAELLGVTSDGATVVGFVVAQGDGFVERGVCYNTAAAPTIANSKAIYTGETTGATFNVVMSGLTYATKYYVRAYGTDANGATVYGEEFTFTTLPVVPTLATDDITDITGNTASGGGMVLVDGGAAVTVHGVCYSLVSNPTIADSKTADGNAAGPYVSALTGLKGSTVYYVRAYATNSAGTGYGPEKTFRTLVDVPAVTTAVVSDVTKVSAVSGGEVTSDGGGAVTARGLVWGLNADPTISDNIIAGGSGEGSFVSNLTGLTKNTTYHVRAYATNSIGTGYGADVSFTTLADILTWYVPGDYLEASYPGSTYLNWNPANSPFVKNSLTAPNILEGYVYMAGATNNWKFTSDPDWNHTNYGLDAAVPGHLNTANNAGNLVLPKGYYKLNADAITLTYTAFATVWGVIGDATPGGWGAQSDMVYSPADKTFSLGLHMLADKAFKFRGDPDWKVNYGSKNADGNLDTESDNNIPVTIEADYYITLDLSHPNAYTYTANCWGIIGDAVPVTGWDSDQNMIWDGTKQAMTITTDLNAGLIKFRANDAWAVNLGGDINALTQDGVNIPVAEAGNYTITLYLGAKPRCTIVKNVRK